MDLSPHGIQVDLVLALTLLSKQIQVQQLLYPFDSLSIQKGMVLLVPKASLLDDRNPWDHHDVFFSLLCDFHKLACFNGEGPLQTPTCALILPHDPEKDGWEWFSVSIPFCFLPFGFTVTTISFDHVYSIPPAPHKEKRHREKCNFVHIGLYILYFQSERCYLQQQLLKRIMVHALSNTAHCIVVENVCLLL